MNEYRHKDIVVKEYISEDLSQIESIILKNVKWIKGFFNDIDSIYRNVGALIQSLSDIGKYGIEDIMQNDLEGVYQRLDVNNCVTNGVVLGGRLYSLHKKSDISALVEISVEGKVMVDGKEVNIDDVIRSAFMSTGKRVFFSDGSYHDEYTTLPMNILNEDLHDKSEIWFTLPTLFNGQKYNFTSNIRFIWTISLNEEIYVDSVKIYTGVEINKVFVDNERYEFERNDSYYYVGIEKVVHSIRIEV